MERQEVEDNIAEWGHTTSKEGRDEYAMHTVQKENQCH